jgi:AcrR family transcriptional regulator
MRDIADAAGLTASNLSRYFESKDSMIVEILGDFSDRLLAAYEEVLGAGTTVTETLTERYEQGAEARLGMLLQPIAAGVAARELNDVADSQLAGTCVREIFIDGQIPVTAIAILPTLERAVLRLTIDNSESRTAQLRMSATVAMKA